MGSIDQIDKSRLNGHNNLFNENDHISKTEMDYDVLIIGGGFGGVYALHQLRKLNFRAHIVEAGAALGGVWHWNSYPGARVDSEEPYYQLSIREVWKDWTWSQRFPDHSEIKRYFHHIDKVLSISKDVSYNTAVVGADFNEKTGLWTITTATDKKITAKYLVAATGSSYKRYEPSFTNLKSFTGTVIHPAAWPDSDIDFRGKRVAIVGAGATAVQCVQEIAKKQDVELTVYIRNPNIALPIVQRDTTDLEQQALKSMYGILFKKARESTLGMPYEVTTKSSSEVSAKEREAYFEELWQRGAFNFLGGNYTDFLVDETANRMAYEFWAKKTRPRVRDPEKRAIVVPDEPPYPFSTKRSSLEHDYYECLDQDNVTIVGLKNNAIREFTPRGIITENGVEREHDIVVLATGYDNCTGSLTSMGLRGKDGIDMKDRWKDGVWTYLGLMAGGCPNMFMVYGPQAPTALTNAPPFIEQQVDIIAEFLAKLRKEKVKSIEPRLSAQKQWKELVLALNDATLFSKSETSWYVGANIPGKKREPLNYLGGIPSYVKACREGTKDWANFEVTMADGSRCGIDNMAINRPDGTSNSTRKVVAAFPPSF
ncbi:cyclopentanone -monooxygenase [Colletotrichum truncatum]|uniref:Cyclopentanone -monooxygenase n=1 Tax=Colletotrichum truncatum TaxID=5467 RepID=A0ACC3Z8T3_COLTU|nr:cyclopentanone -monooxygenase [Colletotrichum truncatum]KAF6789272.1 cyclopentanone -monooxygenase [Colletotrichum truncatum]